MNSTERILAHTATEVKHFSTDCKQFSAKPKNEPSADTDSALTAAIQTALGDSPVTLHESSVWISPETTPEEIAVAIERLSNTVSASGTKFVFYMGGLWNAYVNRRRGRSAEIGDRLRKLGSNKIDTFKKWAVAESSWPAEHRDLSICPSFYLTLPKKMPLDEKLHYQAAFKAGRVSLEELRSLKSGVLPATKEENDKLREVRGLLDADTRMGLYQAIIDAHNAQPHSTHRDILRGIEQSHKSLNSTFGIREAVYLPAEDLQSVFELLPETFGTDVFYEKCQAYIDAVDRFRELAPARDARAKAVKTSAEPTDKVPQHNPEANRHEIARQRFPDLVSAIEADNLPSVSYAARYPNGLRFEGNNLSVAGRDALKLWDTNLYNETDQEMLLRLSMVQSAWSGMGAQSMPMRA